MTCKWQNQNANSIDICKVNMLDIEYNILWVGENKILGYLRWILYCYDYSEVKHIKCTIL